MSALTAAEAYVLANPFLDEASDLNGPELLQVLKEAYGLGALPEQAPFDEDELPITLALRHSPSNSKHIGEGAQKAHGRRRGMEAPIMEVTDIASAAKNINTQALFADLDTTDVFKGAAKATGGQMRGLNHRIKEEPSLKRKIGGIVKETGMDPQHAQHEIHDALRYTISFKDQDYTTANMNKVITHMENAGYKVVPTKTGGRVKNYWAEGDTYKGINMNFVTPRGMTVELQLHSNKSFNLKEKNHPRYEESRLLNVAPGRKMFLEYLMRESWKPIPVTDIINLRLLLGAARPDMEGLPVRTVLKL
jgi:hypothetical protein